MAKSYKYDTGLTLLYENNTINKSTSIQLAFDCGSRCDGKLAGLSHFCEHMFFTGTSNLTRQEVSKRYFDFIKTNAFTSGNEIVFTGSIITARLGEYLQAVQDMICNSTFSDSAVEDEKKVIIQEIVRDADQHARHADIWRHYEMYQLEHFKLGVLGSQETVSQITSKDVKKYVKKYFVNNNCIISICTPLSFSKVKRIVKKYFESQMPTSNLKPLPYSQDKLIWDEKVSLKHQDIDKNFLSVVFKSARKGGDLKYRVLMATIGNMIDDISDGLTKELRLDNNLIYAMDAYYMINKANSALELYTEISRENIKPCLDVIADYITRITKDGFSKTQFDKEMEKNEYYWQTYVQTPDNVRGNLVNLRFYGRFVSSKDIYDAVRQLTLEEVNSAVKELFATAKIQVLVYGNATKKDVYTINQIKNKFALRFFSTKIFSRKGINCNNFNA